MKKSLNEILKLINKQWDEICKFIPCTAPCARDVEATYKKIVDFEAELLEEKPIVKALYEESTTERERGYWSGYLQGLQRMFDGTVPTRIVKILGEQ